jgi:cholesterol transport system auxiliary component
MRRVAVLCIAATVLAGCVSVGSGTDAPAQAYLKLTDPGAPVTARAQPLVGALLIQPQPADALADTTSIAYSRQPNAFSFYQFASWTERPVRQVPRLLQQRLQARGVAETVGLIGDPLRSDWLLTLRVDAIYHDASAAPGSGRLALSAELFDRRTRQRLAQRSFAAEAPAERADAPAAAAAMSRALAQTFDALTPWVEEALAQASRRSAP